MAIRRLKDLAPERWERIRGRLQERGAVRFLAISFGNLETGVSDRLSEIVVISRIRHVDSDKTTSRLGATCNIPWYRTDARVVEIQVTPIAIAAR